MMISPINFPDSPSFLKAPRTRAQHESLGAETASEHVDLCTFSTTKRLRHSGNTKPARCLCDRTLLEVRCSSKRFAHFDQLERFSTSPRREPGDRSSRRGEGIAQTRRGDARWASQASARASRSARLRRARELKGGRPPAGYQPADP